MSILSSNSFLLYTWQSTIVPSFSRTKFTIWSEFKRLTIFLSPGSFTWSRTYDRSTFAAQWSQIIKIRNMEKMFLFAILVVVTDVFSYLFLWHVYVIRKLEDVFKNTRERTNWICRHCSVSFNSSGKISGLSISLWVMECYGGAVILFSLQHFIAPALDLLPWLQAGCTRGLQ